MTFDQVHPAVRRGIQHEARIGRAIGRVQRRDEQQFQVQHGITARCQCDHVRGRGRVHGAEAEVSRNVDGQGCGRRELRVVAGMDPDGQVLEIATRGPGYAVDEPIEALGRLELAPPTSAEIRGARDEAAIAARTHPEPVPVITPDMALEGIHHVSAITSDLERLNDFYDSALGLKLVKKSFNQDDPNTRHWFWASYDGTEVKPHSALTFFGWPKGGRAARGGVGQTHHLAQKESTGSGQQCGGGRCHPQHG